MTTTYADYTAEKLAAARRWQATVAQGNALAAQQAAEVEMLRGREVLHTVDCTYGQWAKVTQGTVGYIATFGAGEAIMSEARGNGRTRQAFSYDDAVAQCEEWRTSQLRCR
jgi:hypothetical protein